MLVVNLGLWGRGGTGRSTSLEVEFDVRVFFFLVGVVVRPAFHSIHQILFLAIDRTRGDKVEGNLHLDILQLDACRWVLRGDDYGERDESADAE